MKIKPRSNSSIRPGFTLIELLVVITIIGVLASLVISQANKLMADGRKLQVQTVLKDLRLAIISYQVDYNRYPVNPSLLSSASSGQDIAALPTDENTGMVDALTTLTTSSSGGGGGGSGGINLNPKSIKFIDLPIAKNGKFGLVNAQPPYRLVDLWGTVYYVLLDTNGDLQVANPDLSNSDPRISANAISPPPKMLPLEVAAYSWGQDLKQQTQDDVVSWRSK
ncbi:prepilin-type N-terminal cleavage/methylation domain-containing protein [Prosthecobacter sp.]|uniref:type II secretion system protein n=1 Tax=Prosthecobacter sp. TaxID=1965333 RepID=UPI002488FA15|nr:prepilin-type N-terminal cleavage/methylation domain-containing protein [Prosthecobacter sp.]MDI1315486.1 prepilin-type N-terminal cleavage/methylation domain-containing protein [Prosthecobacter sp.]